MPKEEKNCWTCDYKENIPGNAHIKCMRIFDDVEPPKSKETMYYLFPFNFDPIWQEEECKGWAKQKDPGRTRKETPIEEMLSIMGRRA